MAFTVQDAIAQMGVSTLLRGFVKGTTSERKEFDGKVKQVHKLNIACGSDEIALGYDPENIKFEIPPNGAYVEVLCEQGSFNGKPFYNKPQSCRVRLNPDLTEYVKPAAR